MALPVYPCMWFNNQAHEAATFYCSVFNNSSIISENHLVVIFELDGKRFMALNGGPHFTFNEAVSFVVECDTQQQIDHYWDKFTADGGQESQCGWCKDKFGVSWQVVPSILGALMSDPLKAPAVVSAFMKMKKFDLEKIRNAG